VANKLYELFLGTCLGALVLPLKGATKLARAPPAAAIRPVGFSDDERCCR